MRVEPIRYRVRYRLSVSGGVAMQEVNGLYVAVEDVEAETAQRRAESRQAYADMRRFQADYLATDQQLRYLQDLVRQMLEHPQSEAILAKARQLVGSQSSGETK